MTTKRFPAESRVIRDEATGRTIRQVTNAEAIHHHSYFFVPSYDDAMTRLFFVSHRTGKPQLFAEERTTGELVQITDRGDVLAWSFYPSHDGRCVYFTAGTAGWRTDLESGVTEQFVDLESVAGVGAMPRGTTALSACDRWWAIVVKTGDEFALVIGDINSGEWNVALRRDSIEGVQFCPDDADLLFYAGPLTDRVWTINRDGTNNRRLYNRQPGEWITHEFWIPGTREVGFIDWPHGIRCVNADTLVERRVASFNAWHAASNRFGTLAIADTNVPDLGLQLFDPRDQVGTPSLLCRSDASNAGDHWHGPFPYEHGMIPRYNPQHTHPHPCFSPDGRSVVFTSDRTGYAQVYEVEVPHEYLQENPK